MRKVSPTTSEYVQISLLLSVLTVAVNLFLTVAAIGDTYLFFGSTFVFLGMLILPFPYVFAIAFACLLSLHIQGVDPLLITLIAVQFAFIQALVSRGIIMLLASFLFWLLLGGPLALLFYHLHIYDLPGASIVLTTKSVFNGILNAAIAVTLIAILPVSYIEARSTKQQRLSAKIFAVCASTLVLPLLISSFLFITQSLESTQVAMKDKLRSTSRIMSLYTDNYILKHTTIIEQLANSISDNESIEHAQSLITKTQKLHPSFFNITTSDAQGQLTFFAPNKFNKLLSTLPKEELSVSDRDYFHQTRNLNSTYVSQGMLSRGLIRAAMVVFSAPVYKAESFSGILLGTINLSSVSPLTINLDNISEQNTVVITDKNHKILFSNKENMNELLETFSYETKQSKLLDNLPLLEHNNKQYIFGQSLNQQGWHIYVLNDGALISQYIRNQTIYVALGLGLTFLCFLVFAYKLSNRITAPLVSLLEDEQTFTNAQLQSQATSLEISSMARKLKRSSYLMKNFEDRLNAKVEEKTDQLEQLNLQLAEQARKDSLTGLFNRTGFFELTSAALKTNYRLEKAFSLLILDIDNFKKINDTYGHPIGDKCLVAFSELMQQYCKRDTDIIGRYGGEEFIVYISGEDINAQHDIVNKIHQNTRHILIHEETSQANIHFTVSIGVCTILPPIQLSLEQMISVADEQLYNCKRNGRDQVSICVVDQV